MPDLSPLAEIRVPPTVWLDAEAEPVEAATADKAAAEHEARQAVSFEIDAETLASLAVYPAAALLWVAFKRIHARRFRRPQELALNEAPAIVLGTDHKGGFLLWLTATEDEAMNETTGRKPEMPSDPGPTYAIGRNGATEIDNVPASSRERWALMENAAEYAKENPAEPLTRVSMALNPWNAVYQGTSDKAIAAAALPVLDRLAKDSSEAWQAHGLNGDGFAADASHDAAEACREFVEGPERPTDPTPPKDGDPEPQPENNEGAFVLIERSASGNQETGMTAYLYTDRDAAAESAKGFPMSQEDAARQGQTTWAEVHPVTAHFAENFETMQEAGRLDSMAALYSTAKEIDGHLAPAHPDEPGAITGQLREGDAGEASPYGDEPKRPEHIRLVAAAEPAPDGTKSVRSTYLDPNDNPALRAVPAPTNENEAPALPEQAEARTLDPMADRGVNHYAVLQAETRQGGDGFDADLAALSESRDVDGGAPSLREIVSRQADESTLRQGAELAEAQGVDVADKPMTADERFAARMASVQAELTKREERDGADMTPDHGEARAANSGRGFSIG